MTQPKKATGVSGWLSSILEPLVKAAVDEAVADLHDEIKAGLTDMENRIFSQVTQLPGLIASQVSHVALDAGQVAEEVAQRFGEFLNPASFTQQVIQGVLGGLPHIPNIFNLHHEGTPAEPAGHETTAGTTGKPQSKADLIREKMKQKERQRQDED
jgi:hypothetical protein